MRVAFALLGLVGHLFVALLGLGSLVAGLLILVIVGVAAAHLLLPIAILVGVIWALRRAAPQPVLAHKPR